MESPTRWRWRLHFADGQNICVVLGDKINPGSGGGSAGLLYSWR